MKVHENQYLLDLLLPPDIPCGAMNQDTTMVSEVRTPSQ
jgi:hypothetical protein